MEAQLTADLADTAMWGNQSTACFFCIVIEAQLSDQHHQYSWKVIEYHLVLSVWGVGGFGRSLVFGWSCAGSAPKRFLLSCHSFPGPWLRVASFPWVLFVCLLFFLSVPVGSSGLKVSAGVCLGYKGGNKET